MKEQIQTKVFEYIEALAAKLGVAAEYVFTVLVRQKFAEGIVTLSLLALFATLATALLVSGYKWAKRDGAIEYTDDFHFGYALILAGAVISLVTLMATAVHARDVIMMIANPEYYAIKEILDAVK